MMKEEETYPTKTATAVKDGAPEDQQTKDYERRNILIAIGLFVVVIIIAVVAVVLTLPDEEQVDVYAPPDTIDFQAGVSLVTEYHVDAEISSRIARSVISMEIANGLRCSSIRSVTLQLPLNTRVAGLKVISYKDDGGNCTVDGVVKRLAEARETFLESASEGLPGAYVEEQDTFAHSIQVAMPPLGTYAFDSIHVVYVSCMPNFRVSRIGIGTGKAHVQLALEQLLHQQLGKVDFQVPFSPNEKVDSISINLKIDGVNPFVDSSLMLDFGDELEVADMISLDNVTALDETAEFNLDIIDAREYRELPKIVSGSFVPNELPESGVLYVSEGDAWSCFEHYFRPPNLEPLAKHVVWVVDTTMRGSELNHTKAALKSFISESMDEKDSFYIQLFGNRATEHALVSSGATAEEKKRAIEFIDDDWPRRDRVNLHAAFLEGLLRAKNSDIDTGVTILVFISQSRSFSGERNRKKIVEDIYTANYLTEGSPVKMFVLGLDGNGGKSDMELLNSIAVTNAGISASIKGPSYERQIKNFFESEFSNVLLSNVGVEYSPRAGVEVTGQTVQNFPLLSDGYEVAVRGLLTRPDQAVVLDDSLVAVTTASTINGKQEWQVVATPQESSACYQSYAHSRIDQLLRLRDVAKLVGDATLREMVKLAEPCPDDKKMKDCIEEEATQLALSAEIVTKGITAMVTEDGKDCLNFEGETEICRDGTTKDGEVAFDNFDEHHGTGVGTTWAPTAGPQWSRIAQIDLVHAAVLVSVETSIRDVFGKLELDDLDVCDDFDEALMDL
ncbi:MAG: hypothetical protein SGILL_008504, partial [Bacillariaceae sp.]